MSKVNGVGQELPVANSVLEEGSHERLLIC